MRNALDIVRGAVSPRDAVPVLTHFAFRDRRAYGFNGRVCISAPAEEMGDMNLTVPADKLIAALDRAEGKWSLKLAEPRLMFRSGGFRVSLPVGDINAFPIPELPAKKLRQKIAPGFLEALRRLAPFVGEDASRPWSSAVKVQGITAMATNNVVFAEVSLPAIAPTMELPIHGITELVRIGREPTHVAVEENAVTFFLPDDCWVRCQLFSEKWPDAKSALKSVWDKAKLKAVDADKLAAAVDRVKPFCPDPAHPVIVLAEDKVRTIAGDMAAEVDGFKALGNCAFRAEPLLLVLEEATKMDLGKWPRVPWEGKGICGVIVGVTLP